MNMARTEYSDSDTGETGTRRTPILATTNRGANTPSHGLPLGVLLLPLLAVAVIERT
jgi:hypothetical protein